MFFPQEQYVFDRNTPTSLIDKVSVFRIYWDEILNKYPSLRFFHSRQRLVDFGRDWFL